MIWVMKFLFVSAFVGLSSCTGLLAADSLVLVGDTNTVVREHSLTPTDKSLLGAKYLDAAAPVEDRIADLMQRLTLEEKVSLLFGCNDLGFGDLPRIGLPPVNFTDSPQGVRSETSKTTAFPAELGMAASWDQDLMEQVGAVIGQECLAVNRPVFLGPGLNVMRSPLGARNFEYMGEDPYLAGYMASKYVEGVQSQGVAACPKHWILNDQEACRNSIDAQCDERTLHEIYGKPFQMTIEQGHTWAVMPANNRANGAWSGESKDLLQGLLYGEYGFDGATISDWCAIHDNDKAINAGCGVQMPFHYDVARNRDIIEKIKRGVVSQEAVDFNVRQDLRLLFRVGAFGSPRPGSVNTPEHQRVARKMATESIVLLKNQNNLLPLDQSRLKHIAVIGPNADAHHTMADGSALAVQGGSGASNPPYEITPLMALRQRFGDKVIYAPGFVFDQAEPIDTNFSAAVAAAKNADVVLLFAGLNFTLEGEGQGWSSSKRADRKDMELIGPQAALIQAVVKANPKTVVILNNGAPVDLEPWNDSIPALVEAWYGGMEAGNAVCDVLFGDANPSGKLPCTFAAKLTDWRTHQFDNECWPGTGESGRIVYKEGIWVGYRWFDHSNTRPLYPFGFGLSYTTFEYKNFKATTKADGTIAASVDILNSGKRAGAEVVELYMAPPPHEAVSRPVQELRRFNRVDLAPGETKTTVFTLTRDDLAYYDLDLKAWNVVPGKYELRASSSSRDTRARTTVDVSKMAAGKLTAGRQGTQNTIAR